VSPAGHIALRSAAIALATLAAGALAAGCGDGPETDAQAASDPESVLGPRPGKVACADWQRGTVEERRGTVEQLSLVAAENANPSDVGPNRVLAADDAYELFERWCGEPISRGFLLYDLYNRGAAFSLGGAGREG
jgi:hypothetical protein